EADGAVARVLEPQQQDVARRHDSVRRRERLAQRQRQPDQRAVQEARTPIERSSEYTASRRPVPASAALSEAPSVRVPTVRTRGGASGSASRESTIQADSPPAAQITTGERNASASIAA